MRYKIKREIPGRIRFDLLGKLPERHAVALEETYLALPGVTKAVAYPKAGQFAVEFEADTPVALDEARALMCKTMDDLTPAALKAWQPPSSTMLAPRPRHLFSQLARMVLWRCVRRAFVPTQVRTVLALIRSVPFYRQALASLKSHRLDVPVLDAAAISMGFLQGGPSSSGSTMFLLRVGELLEDYTQRQTESSLIRSLLDIPSAARLVVDDVEREVPVTDLAEGDLIVARLGDAIPIDGVVVRGEAAVNQSSLTGEPLAVVREAGDNVYAGTTIEEGEVLIEVAGDPSASKLRSIVALVEQSESLKSARQKRVEQLADKLVPWNFLLAGIVALTTRSLTKTSAALMVDYSCALRLSGSIAVVAAQRESALRGFTVKGSRYFSQMAQADTIVFDKTGTLTAATPCVKEVVPYDGYSRDEVLRLAACLEEHFPHPVARAVVNQAFEEGLEHRERHAEVEYIVAHGIASSLEGERVVIGSEHFVLGDEGVEVSDAELAVIHGKAGGTSPLFLAVDSVLRGVIYIEDPLKPGVEAVIDELRTEGFKRIIMLTGDNAKTAEQIAQRAGIDEFRANLLPEDKQRIIAALREEGCVVAMVGDGVNDSPALAEADVSVAMSSGSAVAREAADISLVSDDLYALVELKRLSRILEQRIERGYRFTLAFNSLLLALGIGGVITPQTSSLLHNASTVALSASHTRRCLPAPDES